MNKAFELILELIKQNTIQNKDSISFFNECGVKFISAGKAKEIVKEVAEDYKGGWIPCSERLPEADENVLTCSEYGFITVSSCNDAGEFSSYSDEYCIKYPKPKVIAWQPLPEQYKPKGE